MVFYGKKIREKVMNVIEVKEEKLRGAVKTGQVITKGSGVSSGEHCDD